MSMTQCPECGEEVSNQAYTCPHCGYPLKPFPVAKDDTVYKLALGSVSGTSGFTTFLIAAALIIWIGGLILAIIGGRTATIDRWGDIEYKFSLLQFLSIYLAFFIDGVVVWCFAKVVDQIKETHEMVYGLKLEKSSEKPKAKTSDGRIRLSSGRPSPGAAWRCKQCGTTNPAHVSYCQSCGEHK